MAYSNRICWILTQILTQSVRWVTDSEAEWKLFVGLVLLARFFYDIGLALVILPSGLTLNGPDTPRIPPQDLPQGLKEDLRMVQGWPKEGLWMVGRQEKK